MQRRSCRVRLRPAMRLGDRIWLTPFLIVLYTGVFVGVFGPRNLLSADIAPGDAGIFHRPFFLGEQGPWTTAMFSGFPAHADPETMRYYPLARLLALLPGGWNALVVLGHALAATFACLLVRHLTASLPAGLLAGLVYGGCGFMMARVGQPTIVQAAAWVPLLFLGLERLREGGGRAWFALTAGAVALCFLGGHPQVLLYALTVAGPYALLLSGEARAGRLRYLGACLAAVLAGLGLAAVQVVPTLELVLRSTRSQADFAFFASYSLPPQHALVALFPELFGSLAPDAPLSYVGDSAARVEGASYLGFLAPLLALVAVAGRRADRRVRFWAAVAVLSALAALGPATPLAFLLHLVPGHGFFRVPSRHLLETSLAVVVLAGSGLVALAEAPRRRRVSLIGGAAAVVALLLAAALAWVWFEAADLFGGPWRDGHTWMREPWSNPALWGPLLTFVASAGALVLWAARPSRRSAALLLAVAFLDLRSYARDREWRWPLLGPRAAEAPAGLLERLRERPGRHLRAEGWTLWATPAYPVFWGVTSAGGNSSLTSPRYHELFRGWLEPESRALDVLAVRYVQPWNETTGRGRDPRPPPRGGFPGRADDLEIVLGSGCQAPQRREVAVVLPDVDATHVALVSDLSGALAVAHGARVAVVEVEGPTGTLWAHDVLAGRDTAEWAWGRADVRPAVKHRQAPVARTWPERDGSGGESLGATYRARLPVVGPVRRLRLRWAVPEGSDACDLSLHVRHLGLLDQRAGEHFHVTPPLLAMGQDRFSLVALEKERSLLYENRRAMPLAWLAPRAVVLPAEGTLAAVRTGRLPDGEPFDPARVALVEEPLECCDGGEPGQAELLRYEDGRIEMRTRAGGRCLLVVSDRYYPGWEAELDGAPVPVARVDHVLKGVVVPAGEHAVRLSYRPASLRLGATVSLGTAFLMGALLALGGRGAPREPGTPR